MARKYVDCREHAGSNCTMVLASDDENELLDTAVQHAVLKHGETDTPQLRQELRKMVHEGRMPE
jgi:predicted small metal-binding protein